MNRKLFDIALYYVEQGCSVDQLRKSIKNKEEKDINQCVAYYCDIRLLGTQWAKNKLKQLKNKENEKN